MSDQHLLDAAVDIYAVAKFYEGEGDDELLRRVKARIERAGLTVAQVEKRMHERADALVKEALAYEDWLGGPVSPAESEHT